MSAPRLLALALLAFCVLFAPPAAAAKKKTATVQGKVTFLGKPLTKGKVSFHAKGKKPVVADIDADGNYSSDKVPVGEVGIAVKAKGIPEKYANPKTSGLTLEVKAGKNEYNIELR